MSATTRARRALKLALFAVVFFGSVFPSVRPAAAQERGAAASYSAILRSFNARLSPGQARDIAEHVLLLSSYYSLDPRLLVAIVAAESGWRPDAVSPAGAQGLGQLMPSTASGLSVLAFEKYENLDGTARYLRRLLNRYASFPAPARYERALAGYNAGPQAVERYGGIPPYAETRTYVVRVIALWHQIGSMLDAAAKPVVDVARAARPRNLAIAPAGAPSAAPAPIEGSVADFWALDAAALVAPDPPAPGRVVKRPLRVTGDVAKSSISSKPISSIALSAPAFVADGEPIPVSLRVRGSGTIVLVAKIGPTIIEKRAVSSATSRVLLRPLPPSTRTRVVMLQGMAAGVRSRETMVAAVAVATRSAFVSP